LWTLSRIGKMTDIATALNELGITEWVLRGEPTTEDEFNEMFRKVTGSDDNGTAIESSDPSKFGVTWKQASDKKTELVNAKPMADLRAERNRRLAETDWLGNSDVTMSDAWKTYRQNLRDITNSATSLDDVTWPTKPS
jgi:DNA-directed RNA polymerase subunit N (RpoN/RPB10)